MKGRRYSTEEKIWTLLEADGGQSVREIWQEQNIPEATLTWWRQPFGLMEVDWPSGNMRHRNICGAISGRCSSPRRCSSG